MTKDLGGNSGSREPNPQAVSASGFEPGRAAGELYEAARICLKAERERLAKLKPNSPASTYTARRIAQIEAALSKAEGVTA